MGDSISDLLEWERVLSQAREVETKEKIVALLERKCEERRGLCDEFAAYVDSVRYTGEGSEFYEACSGLKISRSKAQGRP